MGMYSLRIISGILISLLLFISISSTVYANFFSPMTQLAPKADKNLSISIKNSTALSDPKIYYREFFDESWESCNLSIGMNCTIPGSELSKESVYEFYFNDPSSRFPLKNGTFKIALSLGDESLKQMAENLTKTDPDTDGGGWGCSPWNGSDYTCDYETYQAWMILSFVYAYYMTGNESYKEKMVNLSLRRHRFDRNLRSCG